MSPAMPKKFGDWEVIRKEGSGGFASAYLAKHKPTGKKAIIKQLDPAEGNKLGAKDVDYFKREAGILQKLDSKYISKLLAYDFTVAKPWMAIQYFPGTTLWDYIEQGSVAAEAQWFEMAHDILSGLAYAHSKGVVHRDLNPKNIILFYEGARLIDFGLSRFTDDPNSTRIVGFNGFVAPEIELGDPKPPMDIFVAATALSAAGTGRMPWRAEGGNYYKSIATDAPDYKGLTKNQISLLKQMHTKNPAERITAKQALIIVEELSPATAGVQIPQRKQVKPVVPAPPIKAMKKADPVIQRDESPKVKVKKEEANYRANGLIALNYLLSLAAIGFFNPFFTAFWYWKIKSKRVLTVGLVQIVLFVPMIYGLSQTPEGSSAPGWAAVMWLLIIGSGPFIWREIANYLRKGSKASVQPKEFAEPSKEEASDSNFTKAHASWQEVEDIFKSALTKIGRKKFVIGIESNHIKGIFLQGYAEQDGAFTIEAAADLSVRPKITVTQRSGLNSLSWDSPDEGLPNFIQFLSLEESNPEFMARLFTKTLRDGYGLNIGTFKVIP